MDDEFYMRQALKEAQKAFDCGEVPVGAVLVHQDQIIARGYNQVECGKDASLHAEMICLRDGAKYLNNWRLLEATLYCTLEPCSMCAGAMIQSRLKKLVWGARDLRQGAHGSFINLLDAPHPIHRIEIFSDILAEEGGMLMRKFFEKRRNVGKSF